MTEHTHRTIERHCDVAVVGGSAAGLAAALQLGRQRRGVVVVDAGEPRNAPAAHMHGYLGHEGLPPGELLALAREEVRSYGGEVLAGRAVRVDRADDGGFRVHLVGGHTIVARRVLAATGLVDDLPAIDGIERHWGGDVVHCPFCHGYELRDRRIVLLVTHPMGLHPAALYRQLTDHLTVIVHGPVDADEPVLDGLHAAGVEVIRADVHRLADGPDGRLAAVELGDGRRIDADAVAVGPRFHPRVEAFAALGLRPVDHVSGLGAHVQIDATGATSVPGLYAAGNVTDPGQQVLHAAAEGSRVGAMIAVDLAADDLRAAQRWSANAADWDRRYSGEQMWSGNPNGTLVVEAGALTPGRVLDVGAGEGGDAVWLAEQGWQVTAADVSQRALDRVEAEARRRGLDVTCLLADANAPAPFERGAYDLVSAQYASIPRTRDGRAVRHLLDAVAPGGRLLVVGHDLAPMRTPVDTTTHTRIFDPDAYVRVADVLAAVSASSDWEIELHEMRPRPPGAASSHHVDDEVLRARRRA